MNVIIIGCGNIGERHLQALLKIKKIKVFIIDNNKLRIQFLQAKYSIFKNIYYTNFNFFKKKKISFKLAIFSGNSNNRFRLINNFLTYSNVKNLILEKVVFNKLSEYEKCIKLLKKRKIYAYVNCPRRLVPFFKKLKKFKKIEFEIKGSKWGLLSNSIHFLDLFFYITREVPLFKNANYKKIINSKRSGFKDAYGDITFISKNNNKIFLSDDGGNKNLKFKIKSDSFFYNFRIFNGNEYKDINSNKVLFKMPYQSQMTGKILINLINKKNIALSTLNENRILQNEIFKSIKLIKNKSKLNKNFFIT